MTLGLAGFVGSDGGRLLPGVGGPDGGDRLVAYVVGALSAPPAGRHG